MTGPLADVDLLVLLVFFAGALVAVWSGVVVSGFLPRGSGPQALAGAGGAMLTYGTAALVAGLLVALVLTATLLPVAVAVIAAGLAILAGPVMVDMLPRSARQSGGMLIAALVLCAGALAVLVHPF